MLTQKQYQASRISADYTSEEITFPEKIFWVKQQSKDNVPRHMFKTPTGTMEIIYFNPMVIKLEVEQERVEELRALWEKAIGVKLIEI
jgi:hypothetical protein